MVGLNLVSVCVAASDVRWGGEGGKGGQLWCRTNARQATHIRIQTKVLKVGRSEFNVGHACAPCSSHSLSPRLFVFPFKLGRGFGCSYRPYVDPSEVNDDRAEKQRWRGV